MLILLPPSEGKRTPTRGRPVDLGSLSFPALGAVRERVLDAVAPHLRPAPAAAASTVYTGVLYQALDLDSLDPAARRRARAWCVLFSGLWGALRLGDRIPAYRLGLPAVVPGLGPLAALWRPGLGAVLPPAARRGLVVDCRSGPYGALWRPAGPLAARTVAVRVVREEAGVRTVVSHLAKHTRGLVAREIAARALDVGRPQELAAALAERFVVELAPGPPWVLTVVEPDHRT